jgi:N-acetyl sugar amidotransferase
MMVYCKRCVSPTTRPGLELNEEGICSACVSASQKARDINWDKRRGELESIFARHRRKIETEYDCIVPVSGGKDSTYQVHMVKNIFGMNPLCITFRPLSRTRRGEENLQALRNIGVDHIDFAPNPVGVNKLTRRAFEEFGDCSLLDHLSIYTLIPNLALRLRIGLVIWGENPYMEYGGPEDNRKMSGLNLKFFREHHILKGRTVHNWVDEELPLTELQIGYEPIFLGYFLPWDAKQNVEMAIKCGFKPRETGPIMGLYDYADLDCMNIVIHHYFKWLKFGFNRITDHASNEIRKGRLSREEAVRLIREREGLKPPKEYIRAFCRQIDITVEHFWEVAERFRNRDIWKKNEDSQWYLEGWIAGDKIPDRFGHTPLNELEAFYANHHWGLNISHRGSEQYSEVFCDQSSLWPHSVRC